MLDVTCDDHEGDRVSAQDILYLDDDRDEAWSLAKVMSALGFVSVSDAKWVEDVVSHLDAVDLQV